MPSAHISSGETPAGAVVYTQTVAPAFQNTLKTKQN